MKTSRADIVEMSHKLRVRMGWLPDGDGGMLDTIDLMQSIFKHVGVVIIPISPPHQPDCPPQHTMDDVEQVQH